jgi:hypothetical protein
MSNCRGVNAGNPLSIYIGFFAISRMRRLLGWPKRECNSICSVILVLALMFRWVADDECLGRVFVGS